MPFSAHKGRQPEFSDGFLLAIIRAMFEFFVFMLYFFYTFSDLIQVLIFKRARRIVLPELPQLVPLLRQNIPTFHLVYLPTHAPE